MDSNVIMAIVGIAGTLLGAIGTYLIQMKISERQRKWALDDEERRKIFERETEQNRIKRELLFKRLDVLEEAIKIMMKRITSAVNREQGMLMYDDRAELEQQGKRLQSIEVEAWAALRALDSKELMENYEAIASAHWEIDEGAVEPDSFKKSDAAYVEIFRLTDKMRSQI